MLRDIRKKMHELTVDNHARTNAYAQKIGSFGSDVSLVEKEKYVVLENGIVEVTILKPGGIVTGIKYGGIDNLLETHNKETNRG